MMRAPSNLAAGNEDARRSPGASLIRNSTRNEHSKNTVLRATTQSVGAIGMKHYATLFGMAKPDPVYAVTDRRADGAQRIVAEYRDPDAARAAADLLRSVGDPAEVVLLSSISDRE